MSLAAQIMAKLGEYDFVIALDKSSSMGEPEKKGNTTNRTRWEAMQESVLGFARDISAIDSDGIDIVTFGAGGAQSWVGQTVDKIRDIFSSESPKGSTPLTEALQESFKLAGKSAKKDFIIVFTDGTPDNPDTVAKTIIDQANKQTADDDCTVLFIQVGDDARAAAYLKNLDDNLKGAKFDIVDAKTLEEAEKFATTAELVMAAIEEPTA